MVYEMRDPSICEFALEFRRCRFGIGPYRRYSQICLATPALCVAHTPSRQAGRPPEKWYYLKNYGAPIILQTHFRTIFDSLTRAELPAARYPESVICIADITRTSLRHCGTMALPHEWTHHFTGGRLVNVASALWNRSPPKLHRQVGAYTMPVSVPQADSSFSGVG